jgi:hypothetical protein
VKQQHGSEEDKETSKTRERKHPPQQRPRNAELCISSTTKQSTRQIVRTESVPCRYRNLSFLISCLSRGEQTTAILVFLYLYDRAVKCPAACRKTSHATLGLLLRGAASLAHRSAVTDATGHFFSILWRNDLLSRFVNGTESWRRHVIWALLEVETCERRHF